MRADRDLLVDEGHEGGPSWEEGEDRDGRRLLALALERTELDDPAPAPGPLARAAARTLRRLGRLERLMGVAELHDVTQAQRRKASSLAPRWALLARGCFLLVAERFDVTGPTKVPGPERRSPRPAPSPTNS